MKKKYSILGIIIILLIMAVTINISVYNKRNPRPFTDDMSWQSSGYDLSIPELGKDGWYMVFEDDFDGNELNQNIKFGDKYDGSKKIWSYSPHGRRANANFENMPNKESYWCPEMVEVIDSNLIIHSRFETDHKCDGKCPNEARFTGGIDTNEYYIDENGKTKSNNLFSQAFGYFECRVKLPKARGMWSAFWIQSNNQGKVGNDGEDGTEIDIYESAFINRYKNCMGHALLWDGYTKEYHKVADFINEVPNNLYDGYHTFALKWTPEYYVFYVDGVPHWATNEGNVSKVKEFLRLTVEIDAGDKRGPYGEYIGEFSHRNKGTDSDFLVDYVKVWQNENYEEFIKDDSEYKDIRKDK